MVENPKSKTQVIQGYKKTVVVEKESRLILATTVTPANQPDSVGFDTITEQEGWTADIIEELDSDRAYGTCHLVQEMIQKKKDKVWIKPVHLPTLNTYSKKDFTFDFKKQKVTCPEGKEAPLKLSLHLVRFRRKDCLNCSKKKDCLPEKAKEGKMIALHKDEEFHQDLNKRMKSAPERKRYRERTVVEHSLSHHCAIQGKKTRYRGIGKAEFQVVLDGAVCNLSNQASKISNIAA
jgi:hypothetical protein